MKNQNLSGWVAFAAIVLALAGAFNFIQGLALLLDDEWLVLQQDDILVFDLTAWGWILLIAGAIQFATAAGVRAGKPWSRALGVFIASIALLLNLLAIPIYPLWGIIFMVLSFLVIFALVVHGDEVVAE